MPRFDWLYEQIVTTGTLESELSKNLSLPDEVWHPLRSETDHELRAALICLLTAALAAGGAATIIGEVPFLIDSGIREASNWRVRPEIFHRRH